MLRVSHSYCHDSTTCDSQAMVIYQSHNICTACSDVQSGSRDPQRHCCHPCGIDCSCSISCMKHAASAMLPCVYLHTCIVQCECCGHRGAAGASIHVCAVQQQHADALFAPLLQAVWCFELCASPKCIGLNLTSALLDRSGVGALRACRPALMAAALMHATVLGAADAVGLCLSRQQAG